MLSWLSDSIWLSSSFARIFVLALGRTISIKEEHSQPARDYIFGQNKNVIFAFWHNRLLFMTYYLTTRYIRRGHNVAVLSSYSKDGEIMTQMETKLGATVVRGSSSRKSRQGLLSLYRTALGGSSPVITPDGPRGPKYQVKAGLVFLAQKTGFPIIPITYKVDRALVLNSWDNFIIPAPLSNVRVIYGDPIFIPGDITKEERVDFTEKIRQALMIGG
ncbi:MAG: lysophospholipid acyltransferase family protein [Candidatus Brocadiia bacterium]